ncbi:hypothetical protein KTS45_03475 [Halomicroarcula limicola]|uniref:Uncharacterized protein n=1 Tax=Haloarcula limicola TaxID=1429915 RepID=A0A8J7Y1Z9_9EURY|nr:hypothetical protein [Halomicroarcula limicola]MBV0923250.1 hypothetical protein [Halomicroarcula limicola]
MNQRTVTVRGESVEQLSAALYDELRRTDEEQNGSTMQLGGSLYGGSSQDDDAAIQRYEGDGFDVIVVERYYLRTNSDLQTTIIVEREAAERASVTIVAGGGATGLGPLSWGLGSESADTEAVVSVLTDVCDRLGLLIE